MDKRSMLGLFLILVLFVVWQQVIAPSPAELEAAKRKQDSLARIEQLAKEQVAIEEVPTAEMDFTGLDDSTRLARFGATYGPFASAVGGQEEDIVLENDLLKATISTKGARIKQVELKKYKKAVYDENGKEEKVPLLLLNNEKNKFEYLLPVASVPSGAVRTGDLTFTAEMEGKNSVVFRAPTTNGGYFEQRFTLKKGSYLIDYDLRFENLQQVLDASSSEIKLQWENHLDKIERNDRYESTLTTIYYKPTDDNSEHCSCTSNDTEKINDQRLKWVSNTQQFFTSALFADQDFASAELRTILTDDESSDL
ncbi:MAG: membrane protein insertase YidC, partial [Bacteroidota bacterium]